MRNASKRVLALGCVAAAALMLSPAMAAADCGCGPVVYSAGYAPAVVVPSYMPSVVYRAAYSPAVVTAYRPAAPIFGGSYVVTAYRPLFGGWAYRASSIPYTTYRPLYATVPVISYSGCNTCVNYSPCTTCCSPCVSCDPCGGCASCAAPSVGCASCAAPSASPAANNKTFQESAQKPVAEPEIKPIPRTETQLNSMPAPTLPDPSNRTAFRANGGSVQASWIGASAAANDGWQPARQ